MGISCVSLQDLQLKEKVTEQMIFASAKEVTEERFRTALNKNESLKRTDLFHRRRRISHSGNVDG